jgi:hypothetical protein
MAQFIQGMIIPSGITPLYDIIKQKEALQILFCIKQSVTFPVFFLDQLSAPGNLLINWKQYRELADLSKKGRVAKWFTKLATFCVDNQTDRNISTRYSIKSFPHWIFLQSATRDRRTKPYIII